jgi:hypothetical protein
MANRGRRRGSGEGGNHEHDDERERRDHEHDDERERRDHEHEHSDRRGRDFPVFLKIRGARWLGSAPPTAEAYARALVQWRQLPGAISATATDLGDGAGAAKPPGDGPSEKGAP